MLYWEAVVYWGAELYEDVLANLNTGSKTFQFWTMTCSVHTKKNRSLRRSSRALATGITALTLQTWCCAWHRHWLISGTGSTAGAWAAAKLLLSSGTRSKGGCHQPDRHLWMDGYPTITQTLHRILHGQHQQSNVTSTARSNVMP